ncbi:hypothetical protein HYT26_00410 [Candidatus Pacearchaeota archaeon]|nr:hypothetical protein [Candidatus Pacearchaeota archaeon]
MDLKDLENKRVMHIDTSCKLYERKNTAISFRIVKSNVHKGLVLSYKLKKELKRALNVDYDWARIYAICIHQLIKDDLNNFDILIICGDENYIYVKKYLDILFNDDPLYKNKSIHSLYELRELTGKKKLKSYADNTARSYRRRGLKSLRRQQNGREIFPVRIGYKEIKDKWLEIEEMLKS